MRKRTVFATAAITLALFAGIAVTSCKKQPHSCYSEELKRQYAERMCTADCPGVTGCDGKTYCNACEAARQGIRVK